MSDSKAGNATVIDCQYDQLSPKGAKMMRNYLRKDPISVLDSSSTPTIGFGQLYRTANHGPTHISRFLGAVNGQTFEILVMDDNTVFRQGPYLKTAKGKDMVAIRGVLYRFLWDNGVSYMGY